MIQRKRECHCEGRQSGSFCRHRGLNSVGSPRREENSFQTVCSKERRLRIYSLVGDASWALIPLNMCFWIKEIPKALEKTQGLDLEMGLHQCESELR